MKPTWVVILVTNLSACLTRSSVGDSNFLWITFRESTLRSGSLLRIPAIGSVGGSLLSWDNEDETPERDDVSELGREIALALDEGNWVDCIDEGFPKDDGGLIDLGAPIFETGIPPGLGILGLSAAVVEVVVTGDCGLWIVREDALEDDLESGLIGDSDLITGWEIFDNEDDGLPAGWAILDDVAGLAGVIDDLPGSLFNLSSSILFSFGPSEPTIDHTCSPINL